MSLWAPSYLHPLSIGLYFCPHARLLTTQRLYAVYLLLTHESHAERLEELMLGIVERTKPLSAWRGVGGCHLNDAASHWPPRVAHGHSSSSSAHQSACSLDGVKLALSLTWTSAKCSRGRTISKLCLSGDKSTSKTDRVRCTRQPPSAAREVSRVERGPIDGCSPGPEVK